MLPPFGLDHFVFDKTFDLAILSYAVIILVLVSANNLVARLFKSDFADEIG